MRRKREEVLHSLEGKEEEEEEEEGEEEESVKDACFSRLL
ncbi:hypothetical protein E2C01_062069 [Portunus trituberculatus]|uniref:Uncharacterized protein n=1 Tax=Portunus trituberculatus TaxID=210409 RepID=A0A5B7HCL9_PORTR|nr:hypothetical protein [Portunus trituberculatus]